MLKARVISMLKVFISMIVLSLLVGCTKYETPSQRYLRELNEGYAKEAIEREKKYAARAKEEKFSFYGLQIKDPENDYKFVRKEGTFSFYPSLMNENIYARIDKVAPSDDSFTVWIHNKTDKPFSTNYFSDKFSLFTKDNRKYILDNGGMGSYPEYPPETSGYINPNDNMGVDLSLPSGINISNVKKFVVNMGWDVRIVLKLDLEVSK
jgi:hypothetical protein